MERVELWNWRVHYVTSDKDSYRNDSRPVWQILPWPPWTQKWSTKLAKADRHPGWVFHAVNLGNMSAGFSQSARHFFATVYLARAPWSSNAAATIEISQWRTCGSSVGIKILIVWLHQIWWLSAFMNMKCVCVCKTMFLQTKHFWLATGFASCSFNLIHFLYQDSWKNSITRNSGWHHRLKALCASSVTLPLIQQRMSS